MTRQDVANVRMKVKDLSVIRNREGVVFCGYVRK